LKIISLNFWNQKIRHGIKLLSFRFKNKTPPPLVTLHAVILSPSSSTSSPSNSPLLPYPPAPPNPLSLLHPLSNRVPRITGQHVTLKLLGGAMLLCLRGQSQETADNHDDQRQDVEEEEDEELPDRRDDCFDHPGEDLTIALEIFDTSEEAENGTEQKFERQSSESDASVADGETQHDADVKQVWRVLAAATVAVARTLDYLFQIP